MKVSYSWIKDYLNVDFSAEECAKVLTDTGLEVEGVQEVESVKGGLKGLVVGDVLTCEKHPNADRLQKTTVDVGAETCLLYTSPSPRDLSTSRMPSSA